MKTPGENTDRRVRRLTAAGLVPLLFPASVPGCVARHMPDWEKGHPVAPDTDTEAARETPDGTGWERAQSVAPDTKTEVRLNDSDKVSLDHGHDPTKCNLIVCWQHNWPKCPLEVVELRRVIEEI